MIYLTQSQLAKVENYFYWQRKLYHEIEIAADGYPDTEYINRCAINVGYARAECESERVPHRVLSVVKIEGQKPSNRIAKFHDIMECFNIAVHPEEKPIRKYFEVVTDNAIGILRCIESGEYAVVTGYERKEEKYKTIELFTPDLDGLQRAIMKLNSYKGR